MCLFKYVRRIESCMHVRTYVCLYLYVYDMCFVYKCYAWNIFQYCSAKMCSEMTRGLIMGKSEVLCCLWNWKILSLFHNTSLVIARYKTVHCSCTLCCFELNSDGPPSKSDAQWSPFHQPVHRHQAMSIGFVCADIFKGKIASLRDGPLFSWTCMTVLWISLQWQTKMVPYIEIIFVCVKNFVELKSFFNDCDIRILLVGWQAERRAGGGKGQRIKRIPETCSTTLFLRCRKRSVVLVQPSNRMLIDYRWWFNIFVFAVGYVEDQWSLHSIHISKS